MKISNICNALVALVIASVNIYPEPLTVPAGSETKTLPKIGVEVPLPKPKTTIPLVVVEETLCDII
jgi:hypothetical protein